MKIVTVLGARPQFVKAATVSRQLAIEKIHEVIVHTGQHFDHNMSQVFFEEMDIRQPDYHLEIHGLSHGAMTGRMIEKIEEILLVEKPECVLVYGDTNSTLSGAVAASKLHIPIAHVEAGLRSFEMKMPEEINRILTDRLGSILFCPTHTAVENLDAEGFRNFKTEIILSGDVMYDAVLFYQKKAKLLSTILLKENLKQKPFVLATIHRAENTDHPDRLARIFEALNEINKKIEIVLPLHPRTKSYLQTAGIQTGVKVINPVGYFDMLALLENCHMVMTDSGGLQKEAYFFNKFCITLRDQTEWAELVDAGMNCIVGADTKKIINAFNEHQGQKKTDNPLLYGSGDAASIIAKRLANL